MDFNDVQTVDMDSDAENSTMEFLAKEVAITLTNTYPNYPWVVGWHPGMALAVKLLINPDFNYGYTIDCRKPMSAFELAHMAKMAGGELLERLDLPRGAWTGEMPTKNIQGVDKGQEAAVFEGINSLSDVEV
jgi:hypothetical protein